MASYHKRFTSIVYSIILATILVSCDWKREMKPVFISKDLKIGDSIKSVIQFKEIEILGAEKLFGKRYPQLTVEIIDPPYKIVWDDNFKEDPFLKSIGKKIKDIVLRNLKDSKEYEFYTIIFTHKDHNWHNSSVSKYYHFELVDP